MSTAPRQTEAQRLAAVLERPGYGWVTTPSQVAMILRKQDELLKKAAESLEQLVACHDESDCPALLVAGKTRAAILEQLEGWDG